MDREPILITRADAEKLKTLLQESKYSQYRGTPYIKMLQAELERARLLDPAQIPADVITMNSRVILEDLEDGDQSTYTLVYPEQADPAQGKISVLAPVGTAMLGYRVGDVFEWTTPGGARKIKVVEILFQPEASGNFDL